jgi:hypothetical protein
MEQLPLYLLAPHKHPGGLPFPKKFVVGLRVPNG